MLPEPTVALVKAECGEFDQDRWTRLGEEALAQLHQHFPTNVDPSQVLFKAITLNRLYRARVKDMHIEEMACEIAKRRIDPLLAEGSSEAIEQILECCPEHSRYISFATKFCSWHNPKAYVISDGNVDKALCEYNRQYAFATFRQYRLKEYETLSATIIAFIRRFELHDGLTFRDIDKFLWRIGEQLLRTGNQ